MACNTVTLASIDARCDGSVGGIKRMLIANRDDIASVEISTAVTNTNMEITSIVMETGKHFNEWRFRKNTGSYTSTLERDDAIGNQNVTTEVSLQFSKAEAAKRLAIQSAINANAVAIIEDNYGQHIYLGLDNDVTISNATMVSGTNTSDLSGFNLTVRDESVEFPHFISADFDVDDLLA